MNDGLNSGLGASGMTVAGPVAFRRRIQEGFNVAHTGGRYQVDLSRGSIHHVRLVANTTLTLPEVRLGVGFTVMLQQDATGSRTVTWPTNVVWAGGTAPSITSTANKIDVISFMAHPDGTKWLGFVGGLNF